MGELSRREGRIAATGMGFVAPTLRNEAIDVAVAQAEGAQQMRAQLVGR